ncbi:hypothetical protein B0H15DRAFT_825740 [Mycena belliarum]|uniref:Uncharacterized protein n=1 Tax=Mycena belliarum TaxID=1033014 RepID=A0AAD6XQQ5_9AGAR|nr:hypothetical protein B0H15DRAFT_825740 [Mycena belliae]
MTKPSAAQKRKKRREEKLLEEAVQRAEDDRARRVPVSSPHPVPIPPPVPAAPSAPVDDDPHPHDWYPDPRRPMFDASTLIFEDELPPALPLRPLLFHVGAEPPPLPSSQWPEHIRAFVYDPTHSWADDIPEPTAPSAVMSVTQAPRTWDTLRSAGARPWRAIRRRKRRLRPGYWQQTGDLGACPSRAVPLPPTPLDPPLEGRSCGPSLAPADLLGLVPLRSDDPVHPDAVPPIPLPPPSLCLAPDDHPPNKFPVDTDYGPLVHDLAHACSRTLLTASDVANDLSSIVWPPLVYPDGSCEHDPNARFDLLARLPPDHFVFLLAITLMTRVEHHFALFFDDAIAAFALQWVHHCELMGEAG